VDQPVAQVCLHLSELWFQACGDALEKVVCARDHDAVPRRRSGLEDLIKGLLRAELVVVAAEEELGLGAGGQEAVGVVAAGCAHGKAEGDEAGDTGISAGGAEADV